MTEIEVVNLIMAIGSVVITWLSGFCIGFVVRTCIYEKNPKIVYLVEKEKEK